MWRKARGRIQPATLVALLVAGVLVSLWLVRPNPPRPATPARQPERVSSADARLDPSRYQTDIAAIEAVLYQASPPSYGDQGKVSEAARRLGEAVLRDAPRWSDAGRELMAFSMGAGAEAEAGYAAPDLSGARARWEASRAKIFRPAPWFRGTTPAVVASQTPPPPVVNASAVRSLDDAARLMDELIRQARREVAAFGEVGVDVAEGSAQARELTSRWKYVVARLDQARG